MISVLIYKPCIAVRLRFSNKIDKEVVNDADFEFLSCEPSDMLVTHEKTL